MRREGEHRAAVVTVLDDGGAGVAAGHGNRGGSGRRTEPQGRRLDRIDGVEEVGLHQHHLADGAFLDEATGMLHRREVAGPHAVLQHHLAGIRGGVHGPRVGRGLRQRLLAQHVLPGSERQQGVLAVQPVDGADVDDVHLRGRHQLRVTVADGGDPVLFREPPRSFRIARRHRGHRGSRTLRQARHPLRRYAARADDPPAQRMRDVGRVGEPQTQVQRGRRGRHLAHSTTSS